MTEIVTEPTIVTAPLAVCRCGASWRLDGMNREATLMMARDHCTPKLCDDCGASREDNQPYLICKPCQGKRAWARYQALPLAPEGYDGPIVADESFWHDMDDFLEHCVANGVEDPYTLEPHICEPVMYPNLDIEEYLSERIEVGHEGAIDFDWVKPVQQAFDEARAAANREGTHWWQGTNARPRIDLDEYAKLLAAEGVEDEKPGPSRDTGASDAGT